MSKRQGQKKNQEPKAEKSSVQPPAPIASEPTPDHAGVITPPAADEGQKPKTAYHEHMAAWESKKEKSEPGRSSRSGSALQTHPKFSKFKRGEKSP